MITNLFSIFDPSTPNFIESNWLSILLFTLLIPLQIWLIPSRPAIIIKNFNVFILTEFTTLIQKRKNILIIILIFTYTVLINNLIGLVPYIFTATRHTSFSLTLALPLWFGLFIYIWLNNTKNTLIHLVPQNTPPILIPAMVLIETVSNLIRPVTLAVRLTANIIAGHLLLVLIRSALIKASISTMFLIIAAQTALSVLELAVAGIQAYVISVLITLYSAEVIR